MNGDYCREHGWGTNCSGQCEPGDPLPTPPAAFRAYIEERWIQLPREQRQVRRWVVLRPHAGVIGTFPLRHVAEAERDRLNGAAGGCSRGPATDREDSAAGSDHPGARNHPPGAPQP